MFIFSFLRHVKKICRAAARPRRAAARSRRAAAQNVFSIQTPVLKKAQYKNITLVIIMIIIINIARAADFFLKYACKQRILCVFFNQNHVFFLPRIRHIFYIILIFFLCTPKIDIFFLRNPIFFFTYVKKKSPDKRKEKYFSLRIYVKKFTLVPVCPISDVTKHDILMSLKFGP